MPTYMTLNILMLSRFNSNADNLKDVSSLIKPNLY